MKRIRLISFSMPIHLIFLTLITTTFTFARNKDEKLLLTTSPFSLDREKMITLTSPDKPIGLDVEIILEKNYCKVSSDGTLTKRYHTIYKILTQEGVNKWAYSSSSYSPWYQDKPTIKARVITLEGVEQYLDTNTFVIQSARTTSNSYTDKHTLQAPLPNVRIGAIVEELIEIKDNKPYFEAGRAVATSLYSSNYTWLSRNTIEYPKALDLKISLQNGKIKAEKTTSDSTIIIHYDQKNNKPLYYFPPTTLPTIAIAPVLKFSSAKSWNAVATLYSQKVDQQIKDSDVSKIADSLLQGCSDSLEMIKRLNTFIHKEVRYTAYELGDKSIIPVTPKETLSKKYGDCKDKATLLVSLLRAAGFQANVALLNTGSGLDIDPEHPGIDRFDHAIVCVKLNNKPLWIDATSQYTSVGNLPLQDQNRYALIASEKITTLKKTPFTKAKENGFHEDIYISFLDDSTATVNENTTAKGIVEAYLRYRYDSPAEQFLTDADSYCKDRYGGKPDSLNSYDAKDLSTPLNINLRIKDAEDYTSYDDGASITLSPYGLLSYFPDLLLEEKANLDSIKKVEERYDFPDSYPMYISNQHKNSSTYFLTAPKGYEWKTIPDPVSISGYGINLEKKATLLSKDSLAVTFSAEIDTMIIDTSDIDTVRSLILKYYELAQSTVEYVYTPDDLIAQGKIKEGLELHRSVISEKRTAKSLLRYAIALSQLKFIKEARRITANAIALDSSSSKANFLYGYLHLFDEFGNYMAEGTDIALPRRYYEKAISLDSTADNYVRQLIELYMLNDKKIRLEEGAQLDRAENLIKVLKSKFNDNSMDIELFRIYLWRGEYEKAEEIAKRIPSDPVKDKLWIALRYLRKGANAALQKAKELAPSQYNEYLIESASMLLVFKKHREAYALIEETHCASGSTLQQLELIKLVSQKEKILATFSPLERQIATDIQRLMSKSISKKEYMQEIENAAKGKYFHRENIESYIDEVCMYNSSGLPMSFLADLVICQFRFEKVENGNAAKITVYQGINNKSLMTLYYEKNRKKYRLVNASSENEKASFFSAMALYCLKKKRKEDALTWISWGYDIVSNFTEYNNQYSFSNAIKSLVTEDVKSLSDERIKLAAAALSFSVDSLKEAHEIILNYPDANLTIDDEKFALQWYKTMVRYTQNPVSATTQIKELLKSYPKDRQLNKNYLFSLYKGKSYDQLFTMCDEYKEKFNDSLYIINIRNQAKIMQGKFDEVLAETQERLRNKSVFASELDNIAWFTLFESQDSLESAITLSEEAIKMAPKAIPYQHTLAILYSRKHQVNKAHEYLSKLLTYTNEQNVSSEEWYLIGLISQELGLKKNAEYAFSNITKPENSDYPFTSWHLLQKSK